MFEKQTRQALDGITLGVTGHRTLNDTEILRGTIRRIFDEISRSYRNTGHPEVRFSVLSPLAEGADRLVVEEAFKRDENTVLHVVLPLTQSDYMQDFHTRESREDFKRLLKKAKHFHAVRKTSLNEISLPEMRAQARKEAYDETGKYVVDHCDVLIALWDGEPARGLGGTAHIVEYARNSQRPVYLINTNTPSEFTFSGA